MNGHLWLCGPPGAGKSTLAPRVAALLDVPYADVDALVEDEIGTTIAAYVERHGIADFRARERATAAALANGSARVIALGGGALEDDATLLAVTESGVLAFLDAPLDACAARVGEAAASRPLLREPGSLARLHRERRARYASAAIRVDAAGTPENVAAALVAALRDERRVRVATHRPYDVSIGPRVLDDLPARLAPAVRGRVAVVADARVPHAARRVARAYADAGFDAVRIEVAADEALKSFDALARLYERFVAERLDRRGLVVGIGGGTVHDAVGFAAATYQRGIPYVGVPTTLLAAVDAAIGGKTALNLPGGKNLVGTTTQPAHVAIAPHLLRTLEPRDVLSGYGEMLKYGLALDADLYGALREAERSLLADPGAAGALIARCVALKAEVVARDEDDRDGVRAVLNFGHTVGHALERVTGYGTLRHGEAVIVGMRAALALSERRGFPARARADVDAHLAALPVADAWRTADRDAVIAATRTDKKRGAAGTRFVLLAQIGRPTLDEHVTEDELRGALATVGIG